MIIGDEHWMYRPFFSGPSTVFWYETNKIPTCFKEKYDRYGNVKIQEEYIRFAAATINCYTSNIKDPHFNVRGVDVELPLMLESSYSEFYNWLIHFRSKKLMTIGELIKTYQDKRCKELVFYEDFKKNITA